MMDRSRPPRYSSFEAEVLRRLDRIQALQEAMSRLGVVGMSTLDDIVSKVEEQRTKVDGLKVFIQGLRDHIVEIVPGITAAQQAQLDQIFTGVAANTATISDAIVANTPPTA